MLMAKDKIFSKLEEKKVTANWHKKTNIIQIVLAMAHVAQWI